MTTKKGKKAKVKRAQKEAKPGGKIAQQPRMSRRQQRAEELVRAARMRQLRIVGGVMIVVLAIAAIAFWRSAGVVPAEEILASIQPNLDGPADAAVHVVEYGDLACSACRQWHNVGIKEQLREQFGDQVAFEYRHFPVITATSPKGAEAAQCAAEQDAFWDFHDYVYENLEAYPDLGTDRSKEIASTIGLDRSAFDDCLDSGKYGDFVIEATRQAQADGARGTPTFMINGRQVAPSFQSMAAAIEDALEGS